ncbi:MAG: hotdog fold thioesterase, partial [Flavobacteriales bacterium]
IIEITESTVSAKMPVDERTKQPMGLLHGGASVLLIESIGSIGSSLMVDLEREYPVGLEVNANHVGSASSGFVIGTGKVIHEGKKTHIWSVEIRDEESNRLISIGRLTVMIVEKK